jgi:hypothetical protein
MEGVVITGRKSLSICSMIQVISCLIFLRLEITILKYLNVLKTSQSETSDPSLYFPSYHTPELTWFTRPISPVTNPTMGAVDSSGPALAFFAFFSSV